MISNNINPIYSVNSLIPQTVDLKYVEKISQVNVEEPSINPN